jgi:polyhydroxybutyrate depolymerase
MSNPLIGREVDRTISVGGTIRSYRLFVPRSLPAGKKVPLVLVFHGGSGSAEKISRLTRFSFFAEREKFLVVYPEALQGHWNDGREPSVSPAHSDAVDDVGFVRTLLDTLAAQYPVDSSRVHVTGFSNGAMFCHHLAAHLAARIASIAPVCGGIAGPSAERFFPAAPVSVLIIQGTSDPLVPYDGGAVTRDRGGTILGTAATVAAWVRVNGCAKRSVKSAMPDADTEDGCRVEIEMWRGCREKTEIRLLRVVNGGHTWPGGDQYLPRRSVGRVCRDFFATEQIWKFFTGHPRE